MKLHSSLIKRDADRKFADSMSGRLTPGHINRCWQPLTAINRIVKATHGFMFEDSRAEGTYDR